MKVHLKLSRMQYEGFVTVIKNCINTLAGTDIQSVQYRDAHFDLQIKMQSRFWQLKEKNNITLTDIEVLAVADTLGDSAARFFPYEKTLAYYILAEIDYQKERHVCLMIGNLSRKMDNSQLTMDE